MSATALRLQVGALAVLWLGLLGIREAQPLVLFSLPVLLVLRLWPPPLLQRRRRAWSTGIGLALMAGCLAGASLAERSAWLAAFSNLLWLLGGLKLLEVEHPPAIRRSGLLLLLATGTAGVFAQDLGPSLLQGAAASLAIASLLALELGGASGAGLLRRLVLLVGLSVPLMVVLFVLAPRLSPLWLLQGGGAQTGLSDQLDPGSIATLARSDAPALRLQFEGMPPPAPAERYWRVLTLNQFDGRRWSASSELPALAAPTRALASVRQPQITVLLEPTNLRWLPWGGSGLPWPNSIRRSADGGLWQADPVRSRSLYRLTSTARNAPQPWRQVAPSRQDLALPDGVNPRLLELGRQWGRLPQGPERIEAARRWFLSQGFHYTLEPGLLPANDALDAFLFQQRRGFCEHFAAAFSALMRAAGVPARVVIGYQGGEWVQPMGTGSGHLQVQQSDAHAWSEVWLDGQGWVGVDPTAWVVPSRPQTNLFDSLGAAGSGRDQRLLRRAPDWLHWLGGQWQALDLNWNLWVMQFDQAQQEALLRRLFGAGLSQWRGPLLLSAITLAVAIGLVVLQWLQAPAVDRHRRQLEQCFKRLGLTPAAGEPLEEALTRAGEDHPELCEVLRELARSYGRLRFANSWSRADQRRWEACLREVARRRKPR
jgi:transglutaminase-like putative cysteine protease